MDYEQIQTRLSASLGTALQVHGFAEIDSTNAEALRRIRAGLDSPCLVIAESQTAGRGRRGRSWVSHAGEGIYLSYARAFALGVEQLQGLSLVTALAVQRALTEAGTKALKLKWPNDILYRRRKLGGILLEIQQAPGEAPEKEQVWVIFGIGINLRLGAAAREAIDQSVTDLAAAMGEDAEPEALTAAIVEELEKNLQRFLASGFEPFREEWNAQDHYFGEDVVIEREGRRVIGKSCGVDGQGALILQTATGTQTISGGEIFPSLRPADN